MNRWARYLLLGIVIGVVMVPPVQLVSLAQEPTKEPVRPAPEVIAAWEKAGATFILVAEDVPLFFFSFFATGKLNVLPPPEVPFRLRLQSVTDAGLKELVGLTQLQSLNLYTTQVTDAGLKELAGLIQLQTLNLDGTWVTDAGLKELAGLTQLQSLILHRTRVTLAGVQKLRKALPKVQISH